MHRNGRHRSPYATGWLWQSLIFTMKDSQNLEEKLCKYVTKEIIKDRTVYKCSLEERECLQPYHSKNCAYLWYHKGETELKAYENKDRI